MLVAQISVAANTVKLHSAAGREEGLRPLRKANEDAREKLSGCQKVLTAHTYVTMSDTSHWTRHMNVLLAV